MPPNLIDLLTCSLIALLDVDQEKCILFSPRENFTDHNVQWLQNGAKQFIKSYFLQLFHLRFVFFEKATKFDELFILVLTSEFVFLCLLPNFEFSVSSQAL